MSQASRTVACPRCAAPVSWGPQSPFRPFCSERCKMIDLGAWANEEYRVAVKAQDEDPDERSTGPEAEAP
ncbi:MAG: DNA gyrase inhibitor YacG [Proteobacteria bacterium]|nr:DNA gyrase inhibitor YacG [Pseudomonadota bacterium]